MQRNRFRKGDSAQTDFSAVFPLTFSREDEVDSEIRFHTGFMMSKLKSVITDIHLFTIHQKTLKEWGTIKAITTPSFGLPLLFATLSTTSAAILKSYVPPALGTALEPANTGAEVTILGILRSSDRTQDSVVSLHVVSWQ